MRVGVLGGAFNPPHIGHLVCAQEAHAQLALDKVLFVPIGEPVHRELAGDPGAEARLELTELAVGSDERFEVSRIELDREGPSYTVDTLRELHERAPDDELVLILGGDQAGALSTWREPEEVLSLAVLAVAERTSWSRNATGIKLGRLRGVERVRYLDMPLVQVSSSAIRRRIAGGLPIRYLTPDAVAERIEELGLYGPPAADPEPTPPPTVGSAK